MGWAITFFAVLLVIFALAGTVLLLRRYCIGWRCDARNVWRVCDEWWQKLYWLWAPREEKVGLVKAQHPTAQTVPGLYHQTGNTSQQISQSNSDLCLNAQGAFTRFEAVDHDLHPPPGAGSTIPPQPLRPAPRPRPSPLHAPSAIDYIRAQDSNAGPLTPPPFLANSSSQRANQSLSPAFLFQSAPLKTNYNPFKPPQYQNMCGLENYHTTNIPENIQMTSYNMDKQESSAFDFDPSSKFFMNNSLLIHNNNNNNGMHRAPYNSEEREECRQEYLSNDFLRPCEHNDEYTKIRFNVQGAPLSDHELNMEQDGSLQSSTPPYGSYDIIQRRHSHKEVSSSNNGLVRNIMGSIYGQEAVPRQGLLTGNDNLSGSEGEPNASNEQQPSIELIHLRNNGTGLVDDTGNGMMCYSSHRATSNNKLQRVSQYIQSLPDRPMMEVANDRMVPCLEEQTVSTPDSMSTPTVRSEATSSPVPPPPPAPPDPPNFADSLLRKNGQTTGERIFSVLRSFTSQSYIDTAEFCNSFWSSAPNSNLSSNTEDAYFEKDSIDTDFLRKGSDLYSPELNLEAHRTAREVYNSLQDPPASPLRLKDLSQDSYSYTLDPSLTRTSEDIFNSLEQRRKSMEKLNGHHDFCELSQCDLMRRRSIHDLHSTFDELKMKRPLSQSLDFQNSIFPYLCKPSSSDLMDLIPMYRRGSLGPDPEPPPDESNLLRATSCETVCSDTSVVLKEAPIVGEICIGLEHERWGGRGTDGEGDLTVSVLEARDLKTPDGQDSQNTFTRVRILPDNFSQQTRLYRNSSSPSYQEKLVFRLQESHIVRTLSIEVFFVDCIEDEATLLGEATLRLFPTPKLPSTTRLPLIGLPQTPQLGELLFSLSYSHTSEKLTIVVVKARNLRGANAAPGDYFVKVYLIQERKKLYIKKTQTRKGEKSPIFNESITFNVANYALQSVQFRLTVSEVLSEQGANTKTRSVGHVIVGSSTTGRELEHWRQMLATERHPNSMWHILRI